MSRPFNQFIAIDPGPEQSALLRFDVLTGKHQMLGIHPNGVVISSLHSEYVVCEMVQSFGMSVGQDVFNTVFWIGRFCERARDFDLVYRKDVKMHLCGNMRAKDANIRQAIIDRYPRTGGGKTPQIGTKAEPGQLYGMRSHLWSALAVALTYADNLPSHLKGAA